MNQEVDRVFLEEQFLLRLPLEEARKVRNVLRNQPEKIKKHMRITLNLINNKISVNFGKTELLGTLKKLPTIVESHKTNLCDRSILFKTADICHIAECDYEEKSKDKNETEHGICPPLKNVKKKRFRKTMFNKDFAVEAEKVSKELYYLLSTDLEACSSKFEIINSNPNNSTDEKKQHETSLFGQLSSESSEIEDSD